MLHMMLCCIEEVSACYINVQSNNRIICETNIDISMSVSKLVAKSIKKKKKKKVSCDFKCHHIHFLVILDC